LATAGGICDGKTLLALALWGIPLRTGP